MIIMGMIRRRMRRVKGRRGLKRSVWQRGLIVGWRICLRFWWMRIGGRVFIRISHIAMRRLARRLGVNLVFSMGLLCLEEIWSCRKGIWLCRGGGLGASLMGFNPRSRLCLRSQKVESQLLSSRIVMCLKKTDMEMFGFGIWDFLDTICVVKFFFFPFKGFLFSFQLSTRKDYWID